MERPEPFEYVAWGGNGSVASLRPAVPRPRGATGTDEDLTISVVVADGNRLFAEALSFVLAREAMTVLGIVSSAGEALALLARQRPTLLVVGLPPLEQESISLAREVSQRWPEVKLVAVFDDVGPAAAGMLPKAGYCGAVSKDVSSTALVRALQRAARGQGVQAALPAPAPRTYENLLLEQLTPRELEVLELLADGASSGDIALRLRITMNTVRTHVQNILTKLQVNSRLEAASLAIQTGRATSARRGKVTASSPAQGPILA